MATVQLLGTTVSTTGTNLDVPPLSIHPRVGSIPNNASDRFPVGLYNPPTSPGFTGPNLLNYFNSVIAGATAVATNPVSIRTTQTGMTCNPSPTGLVSVR
ncbi:hypothetical protein [Phormidium sp. CCY1219]|uniref:hypothetical protein n=1 Tax=Phormidium sp. CCY1219 TaxID=2886104 RepID=UPI002D1EB832|nr:hypothetical protein [Phormidium sp. CCY1219]MEB3829589.1 hypothetical protein [Phormidium sp. CCY1219]